MPRTDHSSDRLWIWFAISSVAFLLVLAISPIKDAFSEYRHYQKAYQQRLLASAGSQKELKKARSETVHVRQIWIPDFGNRVDRCTSCHLGVDEASMAGAPQPFRSHPAVPHMPDDQSRFGCVACHRGQGRATTVAEAHGSVSDWSSPILPIRYTEASCGTCHEGDRVPQASMLSEGRALMRRAGCFACHDLKGHDVWKSAAPDLDGLADQTFPEWLSAWLANPRALRPQTLMPNFHLQKNEIESLVAYLWTRPAKEAIPDEYRNLPPGDFDHGKALFRESRCISCHTIGGRGNGSAPELGAIGSKVDRSWLAAFIADPHAFQPATAMPQYDFSRQDLIDLTQYMMDDLTDTTVPTRSAASFRPPLSLVNDGESLFRKYGCGGCHAIGGKYENGKIGPDLTGIGAKPTDRLDFGDRTDIPRGLPEWLAAKVSKPRSFRHGLKMPEFGFDGHQVETLVTALLSYSGSSIPEPLRVEATKSHYVPPGRFGQLLDRYRCMSCHQIEGVGGDISTAPLTWEGSKVQRKWLEQYLLLPTTIRPILTDRMIPLKMPPEEAQFIASFIENVFVRNDIPGEIFPGGVPADEAARGRKLFFERYACQSCHQVEGRGGYVGPPLDDAPQKLKSGWIAWWLGGPQRWRADVRCPNFKLSDADATDLAAYLLSAKPPAAGTATGGQP
ncbi:MAG: c-type cytochrome [Thermoanaerobaculia bacterium]